MTDFRTSVDAILRLPDSGSRAIEFNNFGIRLAQSGRYQEAIEAFKGAIENQPNLVAALRNFAEAVHLKGETHLAIQILERFCETAEPDQSVLAKLDRFRKALGGSTLSALRESLEQNPRQADKAYQLGLALEAAGDSDGARQWYSHCIVINPDHLRARVKLALLLPQIPRSREEIARERARFGDELESLRATFDSATVPLTERVAALDHSNYYLNYHGLDDRPLQEAYAELVSHVVHKAYPHVSAVAPRATPNSRIRVGFLSSYLYDHPVGRYFKSWITGLDRTRFDVTVFDCGDRKDAITEEIHASSQIVNVRDKANLAARIAKESLDVLIYLDVGMDASLIPLMATRLAPVQAAAWGQPVTTGFRTIDYFLSSDAIEPPTAQSHYTERLVRLPGLGIQYDPLPLPPKQGRSELGLPKDKLLLLCSQSPFKIHPDCDAVFAAILDALPDAMLVLMTGRNPKHDALLGERMIRHSDLFRNRVIRLPSASHARFLQINLACDFALDTLYFSGGSTSLDAIHCALPIVTTPGEFMRGRQTFGMYREMGLSKWCANSPQEYVDRAIEWGHNADARGRLREALRARKDKLFNDTRPIAAFAQWLESVSRDRRSEPKS